MDETEDGLDDDLEEFADQTTKFVKWLVETVGYPFNQTFRTPPPVDHALLAAHWNHFDEWGLSVEEARQAVRDECGV